MAAARNRGVESGEYVIDIYVSALASGCIPRRNKSSAWSAWARKKTENQRVKKKG